MRSDEYAVHDAHGLRELLASRAVSAAEIEAAARESLEQANATVNGLAMELSTSPSNTRAEGRCPASRS